MITLRSRRIGAFALAGVMTAITFAPMTAEAGWRHGRRGGGNGGAVAAAGILGVIAGAAIASSAARAEEPECVIEKRRIETPSGKVIIKKVRVCE